MDLASSSSFNCIATTAIIEYASRHKLHEIAPMPTESIGCYSVKGALIFRPILSGCINGTVMLTNGVIIGVQNGTVVSMFMNGTYSDQLNTRYRRLSGNELPSILGDSAQAAFDHLGVVLTNSKGEIIAKTNQLSVGTSNGRQIYSPVIMIDWVMKSEVSPTGAIATYVYDASIKRMISIVINHEYIDRPLICIDNWWIYSMLPPANGETCGNFPDTVASQCSREEEQLSKDADNFFGLFNLQNADGPASETSVFRSSAHPDGPKIIRSKYSEIRIDRVGGIVEIVPATFTAPVLALPKDDDAIMILTRLLKSDGLSVVYKAPRPRRGRVGEIIKNGEVWYYLGFSNSDDRLLTIKRSYK